MMHAASGDYAHSARRRYRPPPRPTILDRTMINMKDADDKHLIK